MEKAERRNMRIGLYGGAFNPIHNGHLHLLQAFFDTMKLDRAILIPTARSPHKVSLDVVSGEDRLAMCQLAVKSLQANIVVSDIEIKRGGKSYTVDTIFALRTIYPDASFFALMGEDMFLTLATWWKPEVIMREAAICAAPRSDSGMQELQAYAKMLETDFNAEIHLLSLPYLPISSTMVREEFARGGAALDLVPHSVSDYIKAKCLYN